MREPRDARWPLSAAQHGIWVGQQFDLASAIYNTGECLEFRGAIDPVLFESSLRQAISEAEALHSRFVSDGLGPMQLLGQPPDWKLHVADVSDTPDPWEVAQAWMRADLTRTVDLATGPLFAQALFKLGPERFLWFQRIHHIAMDGFGFSLLARRVADLYTARVTGRPAPQGFGSLPAVLEEDAAYQSGPQVELDRAFWAKRLGDGPMPVSLASPAPMSPTFVRKTRHLTPQEVERLHAAAKQARVGWPDLVLATTAAWLHLHTGAPEVVLGLPVMTRLGSAALRVPCMAMNIVPLRVRVRPNAGLFALAEDVAAEMKAMRPHLRYRYEQLRRDLRRVGGDRKLFGPVVNIMPFDYGLKFGTTPAIAHNISAGPVEDLSISIHARSNGEGIRVDFDANPACYRAETLDAHQRDFLQWLETFVTHPERPVAREGARHATAAEAGATGAWPSLLDGGSLPVPARPVLELFGERAHDLPEAIAVEHGPYRLTYRELFREAQSLADRLIGVGVRADTPVAVMLPRSIDAIVSVLGVLLSGAGYLPIDPLGPVPRTAAILDDAAVAWVITSSEEGATGPQAPGRLVLRERAALRAPGEVVPEARTRAQEVRAGEDRLAYVIYTSGSTGQPNGVEISRGALAHFVAGATLRYGMTRNDRVLQFAPLQFDASVEEIFLALCSGARLVLRTDEMLESVPRLLEACAEHGITVLDLPTAYWHELVYGLSTSGTPLPASLRTVIIGGEAALPERVARWRAATGPGVQLLNTYGPTEATVVATVSTLSGGTETRLTEDEAPIGRPLPGVGAVLLDEQGAVVAQGTEGELYLLGGGLARGYLGRAELTATRFTWLDALPGRPRAYRTGDRARMREDGQLVFAGRVDDELKLSGHRIDPSEIETVLLASPGVRDAAVVGQVLSDGGKRLVAHVVTESPAPAVAELRRHLLAALPAVMVPGAFVFSERLPRTRTGKVDRNALRRAAPPEEPQAARAGATEMEKRVLGIWEQVLGMSGLTAQDDFFEVGGQSLQSIQVANRLSVALGQEVPVTTVFRHPTATGLAQALERGATSGNDSGGGLTPAMAADTELSEEYVPKQLPARTATATSPRQVLLTGATGFVGAHLLDQLLRQTSARVVCLVRAADEAQALERIRAALTAQRLSTEHLVERVLALPSDLAQPWLGLGSTRFHGLAAECDVVLHNAAVVSLVREYGSLQAANVRGTRELLRLAAAVRAKPFHYVSTLAVAPRANVSPEVPEDFVPAHAGLRDGYQQSKWVAERLVQQAGARGLPVSVYRLGRVVGAPDTGIVNTQDLVWRILQTGIPAGALPQLDVGETWTPVDYVGRAIVRLATTPGAGGVFNLTPTPEVRLLELFQWVRDYGYPVELCPVPEWRARIDASAGGADHRATLAFFDLRAGGSEPALGLGPIQHTRWTQALAGTGIDCPAADRHLLHRYLDYCVAHGILPSPSSLRRDSRDAPTPSA